MNDRDTLIAFLAVLATIIVMAICGAVNASSGKDASVYLAAITGLIGVIGTFRPKGPPVAPTDKGDVNVGGQDAGN